MNSSQQAIPGAIGIDLGSHVGIIAVAKKGGVEIILSESSSREIPNIVGYGENQRFIGEAGKMQAKSNFKNTIEYSNRFLGLHPGTKFLTDETKWITCNVALQSSKERIGFEIFHQGEKKVIHPEQAVASYLQYLKSLVRKQNILNNDYVITIPGYYTEHEKKALLTACKLADINCVRLMTESSAIALSYGIFRKKELSETPKHVAFVDFGHSKTSLYLTAITNTKVKILAQKHNRQLGVRDFDWNLLQFYSNKFYQSYQIDPRKNNKAKIRLLDSIEKQRKILSAGPDAHITIESFLEDQDLDYFMTREEYQQINQPLIKNFRLMLNELFEEIKSLKIATFEIELVGGGTRIPMVYQEIEDVFKLPCLRTLNQTEVIARGAAMKSAMLSPLFQVSEYKVEDINYYPIKIQWTFQETAVGMDIENHPSKPVVLFSNTSTVPSIKSLTFSKKCPIDFILFYDETTPYLDSCFNKELVHFRLEEPKPTKEEFHSKVWINLDENGILKISNAQVIQEYIEQVKVPKKNIPQQQQQNNQQQENKVEQGKENKIEQQDKENKKEEQQQQNQEEFEIQEKKKQDNLSLNFVIKPHINEVEDKTFQKWYEIEVSEQNHDKVIKETHQKKNELESKIYDIRQKVNEKLNDYITQPIKQQLLTLCSQNESWLYEQGANANKSVYQTKIDQLHAIYGPVEKRYFLYNQLPEVFQSLSNGINNLEAFLKTNDEKYAHINIEERQPLYNELINLKNWAGKSQNQVQSMSRLQDPPITQEEIISKFQDLEKKVQTLMAKQKPIPKNEEKEQKLDEKGKENSNMDEEIPNEENIKEE